MCVARWISSALLACAFLFVAAPPAGAADSVYWGDYEEETINRAGITGGGGVSIPISGAPVEGPYGIALDPAAGKLYWANWDANSIGVANLDGSGGSLLNTAGAEVEGPAGLAIDPSGGRIYWANEEENAEGEGNSISYANLNGSGGGNLNTTGATVDEPQGILFDPASQRVYWANGAANAISYAATDGSGGGDLDTTGADLASPLGVAIDSSANRIFWSNDSSESLGFASLAGGSGGGFEVKGFDVEGIALDPAANRVYVASVNPDAIVFTGLAGGPIETVDTSPIAGEYISFPVLLKTPVNTVPPAIATESGAVRAAIPVPATIGKGAPPFVENQAQTFSCSQGSWASDLNEAFLYRAPRSFSYQWLRNERPIPGATSSSLGATEVGDYTCRVTATNGAGPTAKESAPVNIHASFALGKPVLNKKKGTARLPVATSGSGVVLLGGRALKLKSLSDRAAPISGSIVVKAKGRALKKLKKKGKVKVQALLEFTPTDGSPLLATKSITLRRQQITPRHKH